MIKKAILVLLAFVLTTNGFFNVYAEYGSNTEDLIKQEIKSYFNVKYEILGKLKYDDKIENFFNLNNKHAKDFFLKEKNLLDINIEHRKMQISDLRYNKYEIDLLFNSISVNDNTALVGAYSGTSGRLFRRHPDTKPELSGHLVDRFDFTVTIPKLQYYGIV